MERSTVFANAVAWRPDRRVTLVSALLATALLLVFMAGLFRFTAEPMVSEASRMLLHHEILPPERVVPRRQPVQAKPLTIPSRAGIPKLLPVPHVVLLPVLERAIAEELRQMQGKGIAPNAPELKSALNIPSTSEALEDGETYHDMFGGSVTRLGDTCYSQPPDMPGQSVGIAHEDWIYKVRAVPCPGTYVPTMADELAEWVRKRQAHAPP